MIDSSADASPLLPPDSSAWLGRTLALSCGLWHGAADLDAAQLGKYRLLADWARITAHVRVLDVGSGRGGMLRHVSDECGVTSACGIDASGEACQAVMRLGLPGVRTHHGDYRGFTPDRPYDVVVSIGLLENVAGPLEAARQTDICAEFFALAHAWTAPGARLVLETTISGHQSNWPPEASRYLEAMRRLRLTGALLPLDRLLATCGQWWEPIHVRTHRDDYARTFSDWARRLRALPRTAQDSTLADWLKFSTNGAALFRHGALSVAHLGLRRIDCSGARFPRSPAAGSR
jgi:cyclopropane-fatty-acyl-phospholipid synthase